jgi:hypothetical protein
VRDLVRFSREKHLECATAPLDCYYALRICRATPSAELEGKPKHEVTTVNQLNTQTYIKRARIIEELARRSERLEACKLAQAKRVREQQRATARHTVYN